MHEHIRLGRIAVLVVAFCGFIIIAFMIGRASEVSAPAPVVTTPSAQVNPEMKKSGAVKETLLYMNERLGFTMEFPKEWVGYRVNSSGDLKNGVALFVTLPVYRLTESGEQSLDWTESAMLSIIATPKAVYEREQEACAKNKAKVDAYEKSGSYAGSGKEVDMLTACVSWRNIADELSMNDRYVFYLNGIEKMDNSVYTKESVSELKPEVDQVIASFKVLR